MFFPILFLIQNSFILSNILKVIYLYIKKDKFMQSQPKYCGNNSNRIYYSRYIFLNVWFVMAVDSTIFI